MCVCYLYISTLSSDTELTNNVCVCYLYISTLSSDTEQTNNVCVGSCEPKSWFTVHGSRGLGDKLQGSWFTVHGSVEPKSWFTVHSSRFS